MSPAAASPPSEAEADAEAAHLVALASLPGLGPATVLHCHREEGGQVAWRAIVAGHPTRVRSLATLLARPDSVSGARLTAAARALDPLDELARHRAAGLQVLVQGRAGYLSRLAEDPAPPAVLFARGQLSALQAPTVALVGTRNATRPGRDLARAIGRELAQAGVGVVSGLALGIDGAAHEGALEALRSDAAAGGPTGDGDGAPVPPVGPPIGAPIGVVAAGLDIAYPRRHAQLHASVAAAGLLLAETPLGQRPVPWRFPARNRIIAGLADAVVVVESRSAGGSMLTAGEALDRGIPVLAVPGHPLAPAAAGTNDLLFDGAAIVRSADDVLDAIGLAPTRPPAGRAAAPEALPREQQAVLDAIGELPCALAEVVARSGLALDEVSEALVLLEAAGRVVRSAGWYERRSSSGSYPSSSSGRASATGGSS